MAAIVHSDKAKKAIKKIKEAMQDYPLFLNHLCDGEHAKAQQTSAAFFLNHLCDGELENFLTKSPDINYIRFNSVKTLRFKVLFISS